MSVLGTSSLSAQIRGNNIVVTVTPDHQDWNYRVGEKANFTVNVRKSGTLLNQVKVDYEAGPAMFPEVKKSTTLKGGTMKWCGSLNRPGFYRLKVIAHVDGKDYEGLCTAGFSPEKIQPFAQEPKDFDAFWKKALDEARQNDLNPTKVLLPERCTKDKNVYEISYNNNRWGSKMYGILSVPVKEGKYPALLRVPGAGVRPYAGDTYTAPAECIVLEIGIHGVPVTMQQKIYDDLANGELKGYWDTNLENPYRNAYRRVVTGAVRGVDYIASLSEWNGKTIGVTGSSQGGFLSIAVAVSISESHSWLLFMMLCVIMKLRFTELQAAGLTISIRKTRHRGLHGKSRNLQIWKRQDSKVHAIMMASTSPVVSPFLAGTVSVIMMRWFRQHRLTDFIIR